MTYEQGYFLQILSDFLARRETNSVADVNWEILEKWAKSHQLDGIVYYQCRNYMPANIRSGFEKKYGAAIFFFKKRESILRDIEQVFRKYNIPYLVVKGVDVARCYPIPYLRTMGDSDILVHKEDKNRAGEALEELGFEIKDRNPDYDWECNKNGLMVELHHNLIYKEIVTDDKHELFFNDYWNYIDKDKLDWSFHYLFLIEHLRKHFLSGGAGLRMFMDLAAVSQNQTSLNWMWIKDKLNELQMYEFAQICFALLEKWFGVSVPIQNTQLDDLFIDKATNKVFANGVFGFDDTRNRNNDTINMLIIQGEVNLFSRISMCFRMLFPSYNNMANSPFYHFVRGRTWLLPIAWICRFYRLATGKTTQSIRSILKSAMTPKSDIDVRKLELKEWGLK